MDKYIYRKDKPLEVYLSEEVNNYKVDVLGVPPEVLKRAKSLEVAGIILEYGFDHTFYREDAFTPCHILHGLIEHMLENRIAMDLHISCEGIYCIDVYTRIEGDEMVYMTHNTENDYLGVTELNKIIENQAWHSLVSIRDNIVESMTSPKLSDKDIASQEAFILEYLV